MNKPQIALVTALLATAAFPAAAGALQAGGIAPAGLAGCLSGGPKTAAALSGQVGPSREIIRSDRNPAPGLEAWLRDYLDFHALAQEDNGARAALMPWPALRTHAN